MRSTSQCAVFFERSTFLASPDCAAGGLCRARVVSRPVLRFFVFVLQNNSDFKCLCMYSVATYQSESGSIRNWVVQQVLLFS